jgi:hypothetical protein
MRPRSSSKAPDISARSTCRRFTTFTHCTIIAYPHTNLASTTPKRASR